MKSPQREEVNSVNNNTCSAQLAKPTVIENCYIKIAGVGRYLPSRIITNEELEQTHGYRKGWIKGRLGKIPKLFSNFRIIESCWIGGLDERRRADNVKETASWMGAQAILEAVRDANMKLTDIDLIINASGT